MSSSMNTDKMLQANKLGFSSRFTILAFNVANLFSFNFFNLTVLIDTSFLCVIDFVPVACEACPMNFATFSSNDKSKIDVRPNSKHQ